MITALNIDIENLISNNADNFEVSKVFKSYINTYISSIDTILQNSIGKDFLVKHTKQTDKFIIALYKYILRKHFGSYLPMGSSVPICLIALGSYGREQLCIYSDIDLMILYEDIKGYNLKEVMEEFITLAWDCGIKLGSRVHELKDVQTSVKEDVTIKTSLIESRLIYGSKHLWYSYENVLFKIRKTKQLDFILEKNLEHSLRLKKYPLKMQANIKDGYGGMRESNTLFWFANIIYGVTKVRDLMNILFTEEEYQKYRISLEYIFQIRNHLHNIAGKKLDIINFDVLPELSTRLGFKNTPLHTKERQLMAKTLEYLHNIHSFTSIMIKKITRKVEFKKENIPLLKKYRYKKSIYIIENKIYCSYHLKSKNLTYILKELLLLPKEVEEFDASYVYYLKKTKHPSELTTEHKKLIKSILLKESLSILLNLLYQAGLFRLVLPVCTKITHQPQFDGYHDLPVDLHSILNITYFENIQDPFVKNVFDKMSKTDQKLAKIATLFHDIGKGRKKDHHETGEKLFKSFGSFLSFEPSSIQIISKLIRYHNQMSMYATNEDVYSEKIILNFTGIVQDKRFLDMLYVLTYCDISAVGKNIYSSATSALLKELYFQTLPAFENTELLSESARKLSKINAIKKLPQYNKLSVIMKRKISYIASSQLFLQLKAKDILDLAIKAKDVQDYIYRIKNEEVLSIQIIRSKALNIGYLLGKLEFLDIGSMNIFKLYDEKKCFEIKFTQKIDDSDLLYIEDIIKNSFDMTKKTKLIVPIINKKDIIVDINHTSFLASLKVKTADQKGLLAFITNILDDYNIEIESAKMYASRGKVRDLFLIEKNGNFASNVDEIINLLCVKSKV